jgi:hypothetical protein
MMTNYILYKGATVPGSLSKTNITAKNGYSCQCFISIFGLLYDRICQRMYLSKILPWQAHTGFGVKISHELTAEESQICTNWFVCTLYADYEIWLSLVASCFGKTKALHVGKRYYLFVPCDQDSSKWRWIEQLINVLSYIKVACHDYYSRYSQLNYLYIIIEICFRDEGSNWWCSNQKAH